MSSNTTNLELYKADPLTDGDNTFNIKTMLNDNWDKIDSAVIAKLLEAKGYTDEKIQALVNSAPGALDTLKELADALGDDANFAATITNSISGINSSLLDMVYQTAGGTATAITLTINGTLVNGYPITFIVSANNSGSATTINGKKLYKPATTSAPTLIAGKAYTVWYNTSGDNGNGCFFIKASATGTALASQVLKDVPFSNENETDLLGTMPNNGALGGVLAINGSYTIPAGYTTGGTVTQNITTKSAQTYTPTTTNQTIAAGQYLSGIQTILGDADLIAANIVSGKNIFGVAGSAILSKSVTGQATIVWNGSSYPPITINLGFKPKVIFVSSGTTFDPAHVHAVYIDILNATQFYRFNSDQYADTMLGSLISTTYASVTSTGFTMATGAANAAIDNTTNHTYYALG